MIKKTKWIIFIITMIVIFFIIVGYYSFNLSEKEETSIELKNFRNIARNATCADKTNKLFLIDNQMVFWITEGNCADASYAYTLFGSNPNEIICKRFDSIVGPQEQCNDEDYLEVFLIIIDNLDADNLGLDGNYKITEVLF